MSDDKKKTTTDEGPVKPQHSSRKAKNFVEIDPVAYTTLKEECDQRIDLLIRLGLGGHDIQLARRAVCSPSESVISPLLRGTIATTLEILLRLVASDDVLFNRLRNLLANRHRVMETHEIMLAALELRETARDPQAKIQPHKDRVNKSHPRPSGPK